MARRFRARGVEVVEDAAAPSAPIDVIADLPKTGAPASVFEKTVTFPGTASAELVAEIALREVNARSPAIAPVEIQPREIAPGEKLEDAATESTPIAAPAVALERVEFTKSSNLRAATIGTDGVLFVEFKNGSTVAYANFTPELWAEWQAAQSAGSWFHANVRSKPDRHAVLSKTAPGGEG